MTNHLLDKEFKNSNKGDEINKKIDNYKNDYGSDAVVLKKKSADSIFVEKSSVPAAVSGLVILEKILPPMRLIELA